MMSSYKYEKKNVDCSFTMSHHVVKLIQIRLLLAQSIDKLCCTLSRIVSFHKVFAY